VTEEPSREEVIEASEAEGVEELEATTWLEPEQEDELDAKTAEELDDEGRTALEEGASEAEGAQDEAMARGRSAHRLSRSFRLAEFHCNDGTHVPAEAIPALRRLCQHVLQPLRDQFGPGTVNSGYRSPSWNRKVGGVPNSQHDYAVGPNSVAADVKFARGNSRQWHAAADRLLGNSGGLGLYRTFIHCDNRGSKARWTG